MSRGLKFRIEEEEGLYYPCSENKGADQLRGNREADLHLCFRICKKPVFSRRGSNANSEAVWSGSALFALAYLSENSSSFEQLHEKTCFFAYAKTKAQISCTVTAQLISAFVFATYIGSTIPLLSKSEISSLYPSSVVVQPNHVCVRPGLKP